MKRWDRKRLSSQEPIDRELSVAVEQVVAAGSAAIVRRSGTHLAKVPAAAADRVVTARYGPSGLTRFAVVPAEQYPSRATLWSNNPELSRRRFTPVLRVPELAARVYTDVVCAPRQVVAKDDLLLPASYHQPWRKPAHCRGTIDAGPDFARAALTPADELDGTYFHLDNEFAGHYGHFITQDLTKLWAWREARGAIGQPMTVLVPACAERRRRRP